MLALGLLLSACGSGEEEPPQAAQQCDETLSPTAVGSLESVLGTKEFHSKGTGLERTANVLVEDQARVGRPPGHPDMCEVIADTGPRFRVKIDFRVYENADRFDDGTKWTAAGRYLYGMGREASANNRTADLFVGCSSSRLKGSEEEPAPIAGSLRFDKPIKGTYPANTPATREAYLTVLHSVTLAVVKELGCENNAGLPEKPVFQVKKWRGEQ
ncbi:hypothetical protein ABT034_26080 [Streptomyces sp. NPDC002773]|uniref:hypothetical protein n=1 Tax=Streptomyces sp. NPDC002773 TaxID=3154430 RepID=UPI00332AC9ED